MSLMMICDTMTRLLNGSLSGKDFVYVKFSKEILNILEKLKDCGYIYEYSYPCPKKFHIQVLLRYDSNGVPALRNKEYYSIPSRPLYFKATEKIKRRFGRLSTVFVSTSEGILALNANSKPKVGGLLLFEVCS